MTRLFFQFGALKPELNGAARSLPKPTVCSMTYSIKEIYFTLQGEGVQSGRPAVFCRFSGCNLWTGLEKDRDTAVCRFCDTDFVGTDGPGGGKFATPAALAAAVAGFGWLKLKKAYLTWSVPAVNHFYK